MGEQEFIARIPKITEGKYISVREIIDLKATCRYDLSTMLLLIDVRFGTENYRYRVHFATLVELEGKGILPEEFIDYFLKFRHRWQEKENNSGFVDILTSHYERLLHPSPNPYLESSKLGSILLTWDFCLPYEKFDINDLWFSTEYDIDRVSDRLDHFVSREWIVATDLDRDSWLLTEKGRSELPKHVEPHENVLEMWTEDKSGTSKELDIFISYPGPLFHRASELKKLLPPELNSYLFSTKHRERLGESLMGSINFALANCEKAAVIIGKSSKTAPFQEQEINALLHLRNRRKSNFLNVFLEDMNYDEFVEWMPLLADYVYKSSFSEFSASLIESYVEAD